jgi:predicted Zn-dependent peptidase
MFHGSRNVEDGMHVRLLLDAGADFINAATGSEHTDYWATVPASELALALFLESDRMAYGLERITQASLDKELRILARERAERLDDIPAGAVNEIIARNLYPAEHPFHTAHVAGRELEETTLAEVRAFHRDHYAPGNALLLLSGNFDEKTAATLVRHYFAAIPPRATVPAPKSPAVEPAGVSLRLEARIDAARLVVAWPTAPLFAPGDAELDVLASYMNHVAFAPLVRERHLFSSLWARQFSEIRASEFRIGGELEPGVKPDAALAAIDAVIDDLAKNGPSDDQVRRYAWGWLFELYGQYDGLLQRSELIAQSALHLHEPDFMKPALVRYRAVTVATTRLAAERYLASKRRVVAFVAINPDAPVAGREVQPP